MERCQSGRMGYPGKVVYPKGYRGFESRSFRQFSFDEIFVTTCHNSKHVLRWLFGVFL